MKSIKVIIILSILVFLSLIGFSQKEFKSDEDKLKYANKLFNDEKYLEAEPMMLQFLSLDQMSPEMNFKYGTCKLFNSSDKEECLKYLKFAAERNAEPRVHFFLGKAYHLNYQFSEALKEYQKFKALGSEEFKKQYEVDLHIKQCTSGKKLLNNLTELIVEEKTETKFKNFPYSYNLEDMDGRILISGEFQSKYDEKLDFRSMSFFPKPTSPQDIMFYSSYGKKGDSGLDLYSMRRLPNGDWGNPQKLPAHINTNTDDAYGFLHSSGTVFYFCSKGHNSMGGYDVFKCTFDLSTNSYGPPVNLDYKINTPDDDVMYVVDSQEENAYFASRRASKGGFIDVYKVRVESFPIVNVLLAGTFLNEITQGDPATIKIEETKNGEIIGVYNPNKQGKYTIILPKGGTYNFIIETQGSEKVHTSKVVIPPQKVFKPLKQEILLTNQGGTEKVIIRNLFDEEVEGAEGILAAALKRLADQDVNADQFEKSEGGITNEEAESVLGEDNNFTLDDIVSMTKDIYTESQANTDGLKNAMEAAYYVADLKSKLAAEKAKEAEAVLAEAEKLDNPMEKQQQADLAKKLNIQARDYYKQATTAYNLAKNAKADYEDAKLISDEHKATYESIESAVAEEDHSKAIAELKILQDKIKNATTQETTDDWIAIMAKKSKEAKDIANKKFDEGKEYRDETEMMALRLEGLEKDLEKAKNKDKPILQIQIDDLKEQIEMGKQLADEAYADAEKLDKIADAIAHELQLARDLDSEIVNLEDTQLSEKEKSDLANYIANNNIESDIDNTNSKLSKIILGYTGNDLANTDNNSTESENASNSTAEEEDNASTDVENESNDQQTEVTLDEEQINNYREAFDLIDKTDELENLKNTYADNPIALAKAENEHYENWLTDINQNIDNLDAAITSNTGETKLELIRLKTDLESQKKSIQTKMENNNISIAQDEANIAIETNNTDDINNTDIENNDDLATAHKDTFESIDQTEEINKLKSELENNPTALAKAENEQYEAWLNDINENLQNLDAEINASAGDDKGELIALKSQIENQKSLIENKITENSNYIAQSNSETISTENTDVTTGTDNTIENLADTYKDSFDKLNKSSEIESLKSKYTDQPEELAKAENVTYETWINDIDENLQTLNAEILARTEEDTEELKALRSEIENQKSAIQNKIEANNNLIARENTTPTNGLNDDSSEEYIALYNETKGEASTIEDFAPSFTETAIYTDSEAANILTETDDDREALLIKDQEREALRMNFEDETKEKKKTKIKKSIDKVTSEIEELEQTIGDKYIDADLAQLNSNDTELITSIDAVKESNPDFQNDKNYIKASLLNDEAEKQRTQATQLTEKAATTNSDTEKIDMLKEAHQLNQAASDNQQSALLLLDDMTADSYISETIKTTRSTETNTTTDTNTDVTEDSNTNANTDDETANNSTDNNTTTDTNTEVTDDSNTDANTNDETTNNSNSIVSNTTTETNTEVTDAANTDANTDDETANNATSTNTNTTTDTNTDVTDTSNTDANTDDETANNATSTDNNTTTDINTEVTDDSNTNANTNDETNNNSTSIENNTTTNTNTEVTAANNTGINAEENKQRTSFSNPNSTNVEDIANGTISTEKVLENAQQKGINNVAIVKVGSESFDPLKETPDVYTVSTSASDMKYTQAGDYQASSATEILEGDTKTLNKLDDLNKTKTALNGQGEFATDEKTKKKIEKKITKVDEKISKQELKVDDSFQTINKAGIEIAQGNLDNLKITFGDLLRDDNYQVQQAEEYESKAKDLIDQASKLRTKAENTKDKTEKAILLKNANSKENLAIENFNTALELYQKGILADIKKGVDSPTLGDLTSTELIDKANEVKNIASNLTEESNSSRDSSLTAKGTDKIAMINRADAKYAQAETLRSIGNELEELALEKAQKEQELETLTNLKSQLTSEDITEVRSNDAYIEYFDNQKKIDSKKIEQATLEGEKEGLTNIIAQQEATIEKLEQEKKDKETISEKAAVSDEIEAISASKSDNKSKLADVNSQIETLENEINNEELNQEDLISNLDTDLQTNFKALAITTTDKTPIAKTAKAATITFDDLISGNFIVPDVITNDIVVFKESIVYSDNNPIPLNPKYPSGLIYKVQVGAFSKPIPNDIFSGFAPITGEKVGSLVRYRVGYFLAYANANTAKNQIRQMGYSDAFVVAINGGERITLTEAKAIQDPNIATNTNNSIAINSSASTNEDVFTTTETTSDNVNTTYIPNNNSNNDNQNNETFTTTETTSDNVNNNTGSANSDITVDLGEGFAITNDADKIEGLFYTVQLGAFSKPIKADNVFNISPLVTKFIGSLYKYSTGIYRDIDAANKRKNEVINLGNKGAFVTIYFNGERITSAEANRLIAAKGEEIFTTDALGNLKQLGNSVENKRPLVPATKDGNFRVDLGSYNGEIPTDLANAMLMITEYQVDKNDANYFVGNFENKLDAINVMELYKANGVANIKVIDITNPDVNITNESPKAVAGLEYRIFLGAYDGEVPGRRAITFVELKDLGIYKEQENGKDVYYCGKEGLYSGAETLLKEFTQRGVNIAEIKAFQNEKEIDINQAKRLTNE